MRSIMYDEDILEVLELLSQLKSYKRKKTIDSEEKLHSMFMKEVSPEIASWEQVFFQLETLIEERVELGDDVCL